VGVRGWHGAGWVVCGEKWWKSVCLWVWCGAGGVVVGLACMSVAGSHKGWVSGGRGFFVLALLNSSDTAAFSSFWQVIMSNWAVTVIDAVASTTALTGPQFLTALPRGKNVVSQRGCLCRSLRRGLVGVGCRR
jgi:hypothetical protein